MGMIQWIKKFPVRIATAKLLIRSDEELVPWSSIAVSFSPNLMGYRCVKDINIYLDGKSKVSVDTLEAIQDWLKDCHYKARVDADELSLEWQHPLEFENTRGGHCVDYALWCWRKLNEIGMEAQLMLGERLRDGEYRQHGWIVYEKQGKEYLFEPLPVSRNNMVENFHIVRSNYIPWLSITSELNCLLFAGYISALNRGVKNSPQHIAST